MADPTLNATQNALFEVFQKLSDKIDVGHQRIRESLNEFIARMETRQKDHDKEDRAVADRVLRLETHRERDQTELAREKARTQKEIDRRMAGIALLMSGLGMVLGHFWK